jgi:hypothetical protein
MNITNLPNAAEAPSSRERRRRHFIMSKQTRISHLLYNLLQTEIEGFNSLAEFTLDSPAPSPSPRNPFISGGRQIKGAFQCCAINRNSPAGAARKRVLGIP